MVIEFSAVIIAIALVVQVVVLVVFGLMFMKRLRQLHEVVSRMDREIHPVVLDIREITGSLRGVMNTAQRNIWRLDLVGERLAGNLGVAMAVVRRVYATLKSRNPGGNNHGAR